MGPLGRRVRRKTASTFDSSPAVLSFANSLLTFIL